MPPAWVRGFLLGLAVGCLLGACAMFGFAQPGLAKAFAGVGIAATLMAGELRRHHQGWKCPRCGDRQPRQPRTCFGCGLPTRNVVVHESGTGDGGSV